MSAHRVLQSVFYLQCLHSVFSSLSFIYNVLCKQYSPICPLSTISVNSILQAVLCLQCLHTVFSSLSFIYNVCKLKFPTSILRYFQDPLDYGNHSMLYYLFIFMFIGLFSNFPDRTCFGEKGREAVAGQLRVSNYPVPTRKPLGPPDAEQEKKSPSGWSLQRGRQSLLNSMHASEHTGGGWANRELVKWGRQNVI